MSELSNSKVLLICGKPASGKTTSLLNIRNQEGWVYLNCENNKAIPFRHKFKNIKVLEPELVHTVFEYMRQKPDEVTAGKDGVIIDSITFLMNMYENLRINENTGDTRAAWKTYGKFFNDLMGKDIANCKSPVVLMAHVQDTFNEESQRWESFIPVKGSLKLTTLEAYFTCILYAKVLPLKELEKYNNDLLHITEDDKIDGFKHVFQTRLTSKTTGEKIRGPLGLFSREETYIDNDVQQVLDRLTEFYGE